MMNYQHKLEQHALHLGISLKQIEEDIVYLRMCFNFATRSKAKRLQVGEFFVTKNGVIVPGYNGTAPGTSNECEYIDEKTNQLVSYQHIICGAQNCVYKAAKEGVPLIGSTMYTTDSPCPRCVPMTIAIEAKRVVYCREYRLTAHLQTLVDSGIIVHNIPYHLVFPTQGLVMYTETELCHVFTLRWLSAKSIKDASTLTSEEQDHYAEQVVEDFSQFQNNCDNSSKTTQLLSIDTYLKGL